MILTVTLLLLVSAFICTIISALGKAPLWIPVILICVALLLTTMPLK